MDLDVPLSTDLIDCHVLIFCAFSVSMVYRSGTAVGKCFIKLVNHFVFISPLSFVNTFDNDFILKSY